MWIQHLSMWLTPCFAFGLKVLLWYTHTLFNWRNGCFSLNELERVSVTTMICILLVLWYFMQVTFVEIYQQSLYFLNCLPPDNVPQPLPALPQLPAVGNSYHFSGSLPTSSSYSRDFYRVNSISLIISFIWMKYRVTLALEVIKTYFCRLMMSSWPISPLLRWGVFSASLHQGLLLHSVGTVTLQVCASQLKSDW